MELALARILFNSFCDDKIQIDNSGGMTGLFLVSAD